MTLLRLHSMTTLFLRYILPEPCGWKALDGGWNMKEYASTLWTNGWSCKYNHPANI